MMPSNSRHARRPKTLEPRGEGRAFLPCLPGQGLWHYYARLYVPPTSRRGVLRGGRLVSQVKQNLVSVEVMALVQRICEP